MSVVFVHPVSASMELSTLDKTCRLGPDFRSVKSVWELNETAYPSLEHVLAQLAGDVDDSAHDCDVEVEWNREWMGEEGWRD